jgi:hypothetical protein
MGWMSVVEVTIAERPRIETKGLIHTTQSISAVTVVLTFHSAHHYIRADVTHTTLSWCVRKVSAIGWSKEDKLSASNNTRLCRQAADKAVPR